MAIGGNHRTSTRHSPAVVATFANLTRSETSNLLDEDGHLVLLDGAGAVLVEFFEALLEVSLGELTGVVHLGEGVLDELLGFFFVEGAGVVLVVFSPDVVNTLSDNSVDVCHLSIVFGI